MKIFPKCQRKNTLSCLNHIRGDIIKKCFVIILCLLILPLTPMVSYADDGAGDSVDYMAKMIECAQSGDELSLRSGAVYEFLRNEKIDEMGLGYSKTHFFSTMESAEDILNAIEYYRAARNSQYTAKELNLLAKIIEAEAGSEWLSDEWKICVGETVLNRVASPEFPNDIWAVISQRGQYPYVGTEYFTELIPSSKSYEIARRLLNGERYILDPTVVFQSNNIIGGGIALKFTDSYLGTTYFCYSSYPELYE